MELHEAIDAMATDNPDIARLAARKLKRHQLHRTHDLDVIARLQNMGYQDVAQKLAEDTEIELKPNSATDRALRRYGNARERRDATRRLRQRQVQLENSYAWQTIMRLRESQRNESI